MASNYQPVVLADFGGLDLSRDPQDQNPVRATSMKDVDLVQRGRLKMRAGTTKIYSQTTTTGHWFRWMEPFYAAGGADPQVVAMDNFDGKLYAYNALTGAAVTNSLIAGTTTPPYLFDSVMAGTPTGTASMYLNIQGAGNLVKYTGSAFSKVAGIGETRFLAVQYPDNRLVLANFPSTPYNSRVFFTDANDPETLPGDNFIDLLPGDGEQIIGMANYRNDLFVFKQNNFWRFYGNTTDATGGPVFNAVQVHHGLGTPYRVYGKMVCSGTEGVYFLGADGVYLTTGGVPQKISQAIDPIFNNDGSDAIFSDYFGASQVLPELYYVGGRLYLSWHETINTTAMPAQVFVYDPPTQQWMYWRMLDGRMANLYSIVGFKRSNLTEEVPHFLFTTTQSPTVNSVISYLDPTQIQDEDHAISVSVNGRYQSNFMDLGEPGSVKRVRETMFEGGLSSEVVTLFVDNSLATAASGIVTSQIVSGTDTSTWPDYRIGQARFRSGGSVRGGNVAFAITGGSWHLNRVIFHVDAPRPAGIRKLTIG